MRLKRWRARCAGVLIVVMALSQPLCAFAETGGSVGALTEEREEEEQETASASDVSPEEIASDSDAEEKDGQDSEEEIDAEADVELINDLVTEEETETETEEKLASDSDAELIDDLTLTTVTLALADEDVVEIPDENLKSVLLEAGDADGDGEMSVEEMESLTSLSAGSCGIADLTGLEYAVNLEELDLGRNQITNSALDSLAGLTELRELSLAENQLTEINPLAGLTNLNILYLYGNYGINDISHLSGMENLTILWLQDNSIVDLSPLSNLINLEELDLSSNYVEDLSPVQDLTQLTVLMVPYNQLTTVPDLTALTELSLYEDGNPREMFTGNEIPRDEFTGKFAENIEVTEEWLDINSYDATEVSIPDEALKQALTEWGYDGNGDGVFSKSEMAQITYMNICDWGVTDLTGLEYAIYMKTLDASWNGISDLSPLSGLNLNTLYIAYNEISDVSPLADLTSLENLALDVNQIEDVSPLSSLENLSYLNLSDNQVSDISGLSSLINLEELDISENQISDISAVADMQNLWWLFATDNELTTVPDLTGLENLQLYGNQDELEDPIKMFTGNKIPEEEFTGKFAVELTESWLVLNSYDEEAAATIVTIPDEALKERLVEEGDSNDDGELSVLEMRQITSLNIYGCGVEDLTGLEYATYLTELDASWNSFSDLSPLSGLNLNTLYIAYNEISDVSPLAELTSLERLALDGNQIGDVSPLSSLENLSYLNLCDNQVSDISGLSSLINLQELDISENQISNISAVAGMENLWWLFATDNELTTVPDLTGLENLQLYWNQDELEDPIEVFVGNEIPREEFTGKFAVELTEEWLDVNSYDGTVVEIPDETLKAALLESGYDTDGDGELNRTEMLQVVHLGVDSRGITDLTGLEYATNLVELSAADNEIGDLTPLANLTGLQELYLGNNNCSDLSPLANLTELTSLIIWNDGVTDISALSGMTQMRGLYISENQIADISALSGMTELETLNLSNNLVEDISPLSELVSLTSLEMYGNQISDLSPIQNLTGLVRLNVSDNELTTIPDLTALTNLQLYEDQDSLSGPIGYFDGNKIPREEFIGKFAVELTEEWLDANSYDGTVVEIPDERLHQAMTDSGWDRDGDGVFTATEMLKGIELYAEGYGVADLTGLEYATYLMVADLSNNELTDVSALSGANNLCILYLANNRITDVSALSGITEMNMLNISGNEVSDISALSGLSQMIDLNISENQICDISAVADITELGWLDARSNQLETLPDLSGLGNLNLYSEDEDGNQEPIDMFSGNSLTYETLRAAFGHLNPGDDWYAINACDWNASSVSILTQPTNVSGAIGDTVTFTVEADGAVSYTWYYSADSGETWKSLKTWEGYDTDTLSFTLTSGRLAYLFHCVVEGSDGETVTTDDVYAQEAGAEILTQPESVTASIGDTVTFTTEASKAISYNWYYSADDGENWSLLKSWDGYDTNTLTFELTSGRAGYLYHCEIKVSGGTILTTDAVYVQEAEPEILTQPESVTAAIGDTVTFTTEASQAISYNWYYSTDNGESWKLLKSWDGYDTNTLSFELTSGRVGYLYHCEIKVSGGSILTTDAVYAQEAEPEILTQPESVTASIGDTVTFTTEASKAISYNWYYSADNGESWKLLKSWDGYDTNTLSFELTSGRAGYLYHCEIKVSGGTVLTTDAVYAQEAEPEILTQPESVTAAIGDTVTFTTEASKAISYNWYYSADNGESWKLLKSWDGYDTNTLSFELTSGRAKYLYHCEIKVSGGVILTTDAVYAAAE